MYSRAAAVVIESAAPLTIFGICYIVAASVFVSRIESSGTMELERLRVVHGIFFRLYESGSVRVKRCARAKLIFLYHLQALLPQMIIFRVNMGHSWTSKQDSHGGLATFAQPIEFCQADRPTGVYEQASELHLDSAPRSEGTDVS